MEVVDLRINGKKYRLPIEPSESINEVLRERLGFIGTKRGCETGGCGSCSIIVDGKSAYSCMMYALQAVGKDITTIEGLSQTGELDVVQQSFVGEGGLQCGFCTPGFVISAKCLLDTTPEPTDVQIKEALVGNLCRCTGYTKIFDSIRAASKAKKYHFATSKA